MKSKKVLVTGSAGFIGFHISKLLLDKKFKVVGIDNYDPYYDIKIKRKRNNILKKNSNFIFIKANIENQTKLKGIFAKYKFDYVIHLAAQAGVRYSFVNPKKYINTNINGFFNVINFSSEYKVKHFLYASSSSVYGLHKNNISKETDDVNHPSSLYGATKRSNELIAHTYSHLQNLRTTGLRFFTVYGEYGRPDMSIFKFFKNNLNNKKNYIFNYGNHFRSFTYSGDVAEAIRKIMISRIIKKKINTLKPDRNYKGNFSIINIGNEKIIKLKSLIKKIEKITKNKFNNCYLPLQKGDVVGSKALSKKLKKNYNFNFKTDMDDGLKLFFAWFIKNKKFNTRLISK